MGLALLFCKVDLNILWHGVQSEETLICSKFGKDLFNISKVIGRKKVAQFFFDSQCIINYQLSLQSLRWMQTTSCVHTIVRHPDIPSG